MKPPKSLRSRALDIVSRREISRAELKRRLAPHARSEEEVERLLEEFAENRWQSDERYAETYIHSKSRLHGARRLQQALAEKGVSGETVRSLLPDAEEELAGARTVLRKKFKQPAADLTEKQKQMRFLAYRGFSMDTINSAMKTAWDEEE